MKSYENKTQKTTNNPILCLWLKLSSPLSEIVFKHVPGNLGSLKCRLRLECLFPWCDAKAFDAHQSADALVGAVSKPALFAAARGLQVATVRAELPNLAALPEGESKCTFIPSHDFSLATSKRISTPIQVIKLMHEPLHKSLISAV